MYLIIEENPNCADYERVFSEQGALRTVKAIFAESPKGDRGWWDIVAVDGVNKKERFSPAQAVLVEDSGSGIAWLVFGGMWGLRCKPINDTAPWSLQNSTQWGLPLKVLDSSGLDIQFQDSPSS